MFGVRKLALSSARVAARSNRAAVVRSVTSGSFDKREKGEEAIYFAHEDARLKHELRVKMDSIMELDDTHEDKQELVELLKKKEEKKVDPNQSLVDKLGLNDWRIAVPIGALAAIPCIAHDVLIIGAEAQLAAMFVLFVGTCHKQLGPAANKFFNDHRKQIAKDLKEVDDNMLLEVNDDIAQHKNLLGLDQDLTNIMALRDDLAIVQADVLNHQQQHKLRDSIQKKLDSLVAIEESATTAIRKRMIGHVKQDVAKQFAEDAKSKEAALTSAIAVLGAGVGAKRGKDVVGDAFTKAIASYRTEYQKTKPEDDAIIVQFEKDVAAVAMAPEMSSVASNVYESHPLQSAAK